MIITNSLEKYCQSIFRLFEDIFPRWEDNKVRAGCVITFLILPLFIVYYFVLLIEWRGSLIIYRHSIEIEIDEHMKKWLKENCKSKHMTYTRHFKNLNDEIRFLTKKDAIHFKMVWHE